MPRSINQAAWLRGKAQTLQVADAPMPVPGAGEVLVRNCALALNPFDGVVQALGGMITPWVAYPAILGSDVAGEVVAIGAGITRFNVGDRVLGLAIGIDKMANRPAEGAFQHYVILRENATTRIPDAMAFEDAAVLPLGIATAACGLFLDSQLGLQPPSAERPASSRGTVIIWGGATSVGSCAIQLAAAAGYTVVTTASPKNVGYVKALGAAHVFDYHSKTVVADMAQLLKGHTIVGALSIAAGSGTPCIDLVSRCQGRRKVSMASAPLSIADAPLAGQFAWKLRTLPQLAMGFLGLLVRSRLKGVQTSSIWGTELLKHTLGEAIFGEFLGPALATGQMVSAPPSYVAGKGLEAIPAAMALLQRGVSAKKVVVSLQD